MSQMQLILEIIRGNLPKSCSCLELLLRSWRQENWSKPLTLTFSEPMNMQSVSTTNITSGITQAPVNTDTSRVIFFCCKLNSCDPSPEGNTK